MSLLVIKCLCVTAALNSTPHGYFSRSLLPPEVDCSDGEQKISQSQAHTFFSNVHTAVTKLQSVQSTAHFPELLFHDISLYNPWPALVVLHSSVNIDVYILYWSGFRTANVSNKKDVRFFLFLVRGLSHHYITQKLKYVQQQWFQWKGTAMQNAFNLSNIWVKKKSTFIVSNTSNV